MNKEEQITDENPEVTDTDQTDDLSVEQQSDDTEISSETDTETKQSDNDSSPDENGDDLQTEPDPVETTEPESSRSERDPEYMKVLISVDQHLSNLQELFTRQIARNENQKQIFNDVSRELKGYKENTLMEAFQKPIAHNLIRFYDNLVWVESEFKSINEAFESLESQSEDVSGIYESLGTLFGSLRPKQRSKLLRQLHESDAKLATELERFGKESEDKSSSPQTNTELTDEPAQSQEESEDRSSPSQANAKLKGELERFQANLKNVRGAFEDVLYRMNVKPYEDQPYTEQPTKLDQELHKTVKTIPTDDPQQDFIIAELHKKGFLWDEKTLRPEEVIIYRYESASDEPKKQLVKTNRSKKGDEIDG